MSFMKSSRRFTMKLSAEILIKKMYKISCGIRSEGCDVVVFSC